MNNIKTTVAKYANVFFAAFALMVATTGCVWLLHRPEIPQDLVRK